MSVLRARKTGYKPDGTLPLINIVLLLVLAFMMAGTFAEPLQPSFDPLRSEAPLADAPVPPVILTMNAEGLLLLDGRALSSGDIDRLLADLASDDQHLELRVDARAYAQGVIAVLETAQTSGVMSVQVVTLGRK